MAIKALIIDDSPFARKIIRHHLVRSGCKVVGETETAALGLKLFRDLCPDLVTLDVMMPEIDGVDSVAAFRTMRKESPRCHIIIVSSLPFERTRDTFIKEGALAYIVKPFTQFSFEAVRQKLMRIFPEARPD